MTQPDVSVVIAARKAEHCIDRAVQSALLSRGVTVEIIAVDDASTDRTFEVLREFATGDSRVIIDQLPANGGPSVARNHAIARASGTFIAILDADDAIEPDRLARLVQQAERNAADIVVDNMMEVDERGRILGSGLFLKSPAFSICRTIDLATWVNFNQPMRGGDCLGYLKPVIRRSTLERHRVSYDAALRNSEDYYLIAELLARGARMIYTPEPGYRYTRSASSTSHRLNPSHTRAWLEAEDRFLRRHGATLDEAEKRALARRGRSLRHTDQLVAATEALKSRRVGALLRLLAADLESTAYTLATFARVAGSRLRGPST